MPCIHCVPSPCFVELMRLRTPVTVVPKAAVTGQRKSRKARHLGVQGAGFDGPGAVFRGSLGEGQVSPRRSRREGHRLLRQPNPRGQVLQGHVPRGHEGVEGGGDLREGDGDVEQLECWRAPLGIQPEAEGGDGD